MKIPMLFLAALMIAVPAGAQDLPAEVAKHVIDRCYTATAHFRLWKARSDGHRVPLTASTIIAELKSAKHTTAVHREARRDGSGPGAREPDATVRHRVRRVLSEQCRGR